MKRLLSPMIAPRRIEALLAAMGSIRAGVIGDACIDVYWDADMTLSRLARENPHYFLPVVNERLSPGGGSNVAACAAALCDADVLLLGALGDDWRGRELVRMLPAYGIAAENLVISPEWNTTAYCKPLRRGLSDLVYEDPHLYFENHRPLPAAVEAQVLARLEVLLDRVDVLIVADYLQFGVVTEAVRERIIRAGAEKRLILVDSRDRIDRYRHVILKPNDMEALWAIAPGAAPGEATLPRLETIALELACRQQSAVCVTLGGQGCLWTEGETVALIPTAPAPPPIDIVGAGDCFAAVFAVARAAGATGEEAAALANLAAGVVVRKLGTTGTASPEEIRQRLQEDLAE